MIALLYGRDFAPLLAVPLERIIAAGAERHTEIVALTIERALERPALCARVERLYVLPFDLPPSETAPVSAVLRRLFPRAEFLNPPDVHELCWDKVRTNTRLLDRGVPVPESLYTTSAEEARAFVAEHQFVVLKEIRGCGGAGHLALCDTEDVVVGEARDRRFVVEFDEAAAERRLAEGVLSCPPPYYLQKLVGTADAKERFIPPQVLRAYVVERQLTFWTERFRDHYRRPSDWIINVGLGARYRFVAETSSELRTLALRAADVLDIRVGAIDIVRTSRGGPFVIEADTDGCHMYIDRSFVQVPEFRAPQDFDAQIAAALIAPVPEVHPRRGVPQEEREEETGNREQGRGNREEGRGRREEGRGNWGRGAREEGAGREGRDRWMARAPRREDEKREYPPRRGFGPDAPRGGRADGGPRKMPWRNSPTGPRSREDAAPARAPRGFGPRPYPRDRRAPGTAARDAVRNRRVAGGRSAEDAGPQEPQRHRKTEVTFAPGRRRSASGSTVEARPFERRNSARTQAKPQPRGGPLTPPVAGPRPKALRRSAGDSRNPPPPRTRAGSPRADSARSTAKGKPWRRREADDRGREPGASAKVRKRPGVHPGTGGRKKPPE